MRAALFALVACLAFGCGGPTAPSPAMVVTVLPGTDLLAIGSTETYSAFAVRSNGNGTPAAAIWTTDAPAVATVSSQGLVSAISAGVATITATFEGVSGRRALRVLPSYAGSWAGAYRTTACSGNRCTFQYAVGATSGIVAVFLTQLRDQVSGFLVLDSMMMPVSGSISNSGDLSLTGEWRPSSPTEVRARVENWTSTLDAGRAMTGRFTHLYPDSSQPFPTAPLTDRVDSELLNVRPIGPP